MVTIFDNLEWPFGWISSRDILKSNIGKTSRKRKLYLTYEMVLCLPTPTAHGLSSSTELLTGHVSVSMRAQIITLFSIYRYISITVLSLTESFPIATMCNKHLYCGCSPVGVDATTRHNRDRLWAVSYTNNKYWHIVTRTWRTTSF